MKYYRKILSFVTLVVLISLTTSCEEMLVEAPQSSVTSELMWEEPEDALGAMYGAYSQFRSAYGGNYHNWGDHRTGFIGQGTSSGSFFKENLWRNNLVANDDGTDWGSMYTLINDVNLIIKYAPEIEFSSVNEESFILGNAYFLRAFAYYYIGRIWGDAPVIVQPNESSDQEGLYPTRNSVDEVFDQAVNDVNQAISLIPEDDIRGKGIASKEAAHMLATDIYLWNSRLNGIDMLQEANNAIDYVLNSSNYSLSDSYQNVFHDDNNQELILSIIYDSDETTNSAGLVNEATGIPEEYRNNPIPVGSSTNWYNITESFKNYLQEVENDTRADINAAEFTYVTNDGSEVTEFWNEKFIGTLQSGTRIYDSDFRVYRYAEAILFKAEILNELGQTAEAIEYLNTIANRAYKQENYYSSSLSYEDVNTAILNERIKEFSLEGKAWFDLIKFGKEFEMVETLQGREGEQNILLWPVSFNSINRNPNITQTPGYE